MIKLLAKSRIYLLLLVGLLLPQLAMSQPATKMKYFDGKFLTASDLQSVHISIPGLFNPASGERSTREDFEKSITLSKFYDENSSLLADAYNNKLAIEKLVIEVEIVSKDSNKRSTYLTYELTNVQISSYTMSHDTDVEPLENISLSFSKVEIHYKDHDASQ